MKTRHRVQKWRAENPTGTRQQCQAALRLTRRTVQRYWELTLADATNSKASAPLLPPSAPLLPPSAPHVRDSDAAGGATLEPDGATFAPNRATFDDSGATCPSPPHSPPLRGDLISISDAHRPRPDADEPAGSNGRPAGVGFSDAVVWVQHDHRGDGSMGSRVYRGMPPDQYTHDGRWAGAAEPPPGTDGHRFWCAAVRKWIDYHQDRERAGLPFDERYRAFRSRFEAMDRNRS